MAFLPVADGWIGTRVHKPLWDSGADWLAGMKGDLSLAFQSTWSGEEPRSDKQRKRDDILWLRWSRRRAKRKILVSVRVDACCGRDWLSKGSKTKS